MLRFNWIAFTVAMFLGSAAGAQTPSGTDTPPPPPLIPTKASPSVQPLVGTPLTPVVVSTRTVTKPIGDSLQNLCSFDTSSAPALKDLCDKFKAQKVSLNAARVAGGGVAAAGLPPGYYSAQLKVDVCAITKQVNGQALAEANAPPPSKTTKGGKAAKAPADQAAANAPSPVQALESVVTTCAAGESRAATLTSFGVQAVQGLGDFLVARSKEEVLDFAIEMQAKSLCTGNLKDFLTNSCKILYPNGVDGPPDLDSAADGRLASALRTDFSLFPGLLLAKIVDQQIGQNPPNPQLDEVLHAVGDGAVDAASDKNLSRFFDDALAKLPADATTDFACQLSDGSSPSKPACVAAFMLEVGSVAVAQPGTDPVTLVTQAATTFCQRFGKQTTPPGAAGQCVFGAGDYPTINAQAIATVTAADGLGNVKVSSPVMGPSQIAALQTIATDVLAPLSQVPLKGTNASIGQILQIVKDAVAFAEALANRDGSGALAAAQDIIVVVAAIDPSLAPDSKTFAFVLSIATAKSSDDVEAAFEAAAAPLGSWRRKYGSGTSAVGLVTVNGFVGYGLGGLHALNRTDDVAAWQFYQRLSAPVGLDVNLWGGKYFNVGLGGTVIDPLALTVVTKNGVATEASWASLLDLGGYLRVGLGGSPINLLGSVTYNPGLQPNGGCPAGGTTSCWRGAWQVGATLVVDVPIIPIH